MVVAGVFLLQGDFESAFVVAAIGMVAWFLNYRAQIKEKLAANDFVQEESNEESDLDEDE